MKDIMNAKRMVLLVVAALVLLSTPAAQAFYNPHTGRWLSRDPLGEEGGVNLNGMVCNDPVSRIDVLALWGTTIHKQMTTDWCFAAGMTHEAASAVGDWDERVDSDFSTFTFSDFNWSWHFNRSAFGTDSRLAIHASEVQRAKEWCTWKPGRKDNWTEAAKHLGRALHPLQDWAAHGDFNRKSEAPNIAMVPFVEKITYAHNYFSKQPGQGWESVDNQTLDSDGPDGRADFSVLKLAKSNQRGDKLYWAMFHPGMKRYQLTADKTYETLFDFLNYVEVKGRSCGECQRHFLGMQGPPAPEWF